MLDSDEFWQAINPPIAKDTVSVGSEDDAFDHFESVVREWRTTLGLDSWRLYIQRDNEEEAFAACSADATYQKAELTVNAKAMFEAGFSPLQIESVTVHELVHAMLWLAFNQLANPKIPADVISHFEETTVESVAISLLRAKYANRPELRELWSRITVNAPGPFMSVTG